MTVGREYFPPPQSQSPAYQRAARELQQCEHAAMELRRLVNGDASANLRATTLERHPLARVLDTAAVLDAHAAALHDFLTRTLRQ